ncbi:MAG: FAD-dependent oxidoreductase [Verrucomicrobiota bacterium]
MPKIAIIGAGVSGLAAAFQLAEEEVEVRIFEKSRGFSGRAASRSKNGCRYDYGANYFKVNCNEVASLLFRDLPTDDLCRIVGDVSIFNVDNEIGEGDPALNAGAKWTYRSGISNLGKLMVEVGKLNVKRETLITKLEDDDNSWTLIDESLQSHRGFDAVLITPPAPQTTNLLKQSEIDSDLVDLLTGELAQSNYHSQFCVALNYPGQIQFPGQAYALINTDRQHALAWLSHENQKAGHVPEGETLLIAQMAPDWTQDHYHEEREEIIRLAHEAVDSLLPQELPALRWADTQRWRYAHPHSAASLEAMRPGAELGLFFAGDAFIGKGRLARAIETGFAAANQIGQFLGVR